MRAGGGQELELPPGSPREGVEAGPESLSPFAPPRSRVPTCTLRGGRAGCPGRGRGERPTLPLPSAGGRTFPAPGWGLRPRECAALAGGARGRIREKVPCPLTYAPRPAPGFRPRGSGVLRASLPAPLAWRPFLTPDLASVPTSACTIPFFPKPLYLKSAFDHFAPKLQTRNPGTNSLPAPSQSRRKAGSGKFQP